MNHKKTIIVAYDFTERGNIAMQHAMLIGEPMQARITLLHITSNEKEKKKAERKLEEQRRDFSYNYEIDTTVIKGNLAAEIKKYAEYEKALLVIIGTKNPLQGFEKLFGGQTLKIIMGGKVPFLVVREEPHYETLKKIVVPINYESYNKEKLTWVRVLSNFFNIKIELFVQNEESSEERSDTRANYLFAKRYLDRYKINRKTTLAPKGVAFREALIAHAHKTEADLILIMTSEHLSLLDYLIGADEEYVIANNHKIPVMCINPRIDLVKYTNFF